MAMFFKETFAGCRIFGNEEDGNAATEYALVALCIGFAAIAGLQQLAAGVSSTLRDLVSYLFVTPTSIS